MAGRDAVRLVDVARLAGVTVSTASRALSRPDMVRPETRERVQTAARELGYVPNRIARSLITGRSATIVLVVPDMTSPLFSLIARAAEAAARERGYDALFADSLMEADREAGIIDAASKFADGIIVCMPQASYRPHSGTPPIVSVNRRMRGAHAVLVDQATIIEQQVDHLTRLGHERIVYFDGPKQYWATHQRRRHAERLARVHDLEITQSVDWSFDAGRDAVDRIAPDITAVIAFADTQAAGVLSRCAEVGRRVPEDLSVIGSNDVPLARMLTPALTTVRAPLDELGRTAVRLLLDLPNGTEAPAVIETLTTELVERGSTGPPRAVRTRPTAEASAVS